MLQSFDISSSLDDEEDDEDNAVSEALAWLGVNNFHSLSPLGRLTTRQARQAGRRKGGLAA